MEELGADSATYHRQLGRLLHLRRGDFLFALGSQATALREGLLENGNDPAQVAVIADVAPVRERLAGFKGAVFLKGSRRYQLETSSTPTLPPMPTDPAPSPQTARLVAARDEALRRLHAAPGGRPDQEQPLAPRCCPAATWPPAPASWPPLPLPCIRPPMRTNFSPTSAAARLMATRPQPAKTDTGSTPPFEARWCEWPRRTRRRARAVGIWQTLQQIQARHA